MRPCHCLSDAVADFRSISPPARARNRAGDQCGDYPIQHIVVIFQGKNIFLDHYFGTNPVAMNGIARLHRASGTPEVTD